MKGFVHLFALTFLFCATVTSFGYPHPDEPEKDNPLMGTITGRVAEEGTEDPMEYATVAVYKAKDSSLVGGTVTDREGNFEIRKLPYGEYYIITNYVGYNEKVIEPVMLTPDSRQVRLGLLELTVNTQAIEEVEVVADRKHVEYRLDKKVVNVSQSLTAAGGTAVDVLENTPSVSVDIEGNVTLRGSGSFTVLIDGKPSVLEGSDALQQIPASAIENIEIITNPSAKYDPDGNSGIINVVMKKKTSQGLNGIVNASAGLNNKYRFDALLNRKVGNWNFFIGGSYNNNLYPGDMSRQQITYSDSLDRYLDSDGAFDFRRRGAQLKGGLTYDISEKSSITFEADLGNYGFGIDRSNRTREYTVPSGEDVFFVSKSILDRSGRYYSLNANFMQTFDSKDHKLTAMVQFSQSDGESVDSQEDFNTASDYVIEDVIAERIRAIELEDEVEFRFQLDYTRPVGSTSKFEAGYQARIDDEFEDYIYEEYNNDADVWMENILYSNHLDFNRNIQAAYATFGGEWNGFQYQLGLRGEYTYRRLGQQLSDEEYLINRLDYYPTVHFARQFKNDHQVMLSYSKRVDRPRGYYLEPNPSYVDPYTIMVGNPGLQPEYIHSVEMGYQKGFGTNFLAFELYYRNTTNLITRVTEYSDSLDLFIIKIENLNEDHSAGAEFMVNWKFWDWLTLNGSFTPYYYRVKGRVNDETIDRESFNWDSDLNTTFQITPTTRFQSNMAYRSKTVSAQGTRKGFFYTNLAFRQDFFNRKMSATLQLRDLFGTVKRDFTNTGPNFAQHVLMVREPRMLMLTLSYRINNYKTDMGERGEGGGGMDLGEGF